PCMRRGGPVSIPNPNFRPNPVHVVRLGGGLLLELSILQCPPNASRSRGGEKWTVEHRAGRVEHEGGARAGKGGGGLPGAAFFHHLDPRAVDRLIANNVFDDRHFIGYALPPRGGSGISAWPGEAAAGRKDARDSGAVGGALPVAHV